MDTKEDYAAKLEPTSKKRSQLKPEAALYKKLQGGEGIPKIHLITTEGQYNIMIMELLWKSLETLFHEHEKEFSIPTILVLADQMVSLKYFLVIVLDFKNRIFSYQMLHTS